MHICFISQEFPRKGVSYGGIGIFLLTFSAELVKKGHQVTVVGVLGNESKNETFNGVRVVTIPHSRVRLIGWWRNYGRVSKFLKNLHKTSPIDIVEGSELTLAFLKKIDGIPYVIRLHGGHHFFAEGENRAVNRWKGFQEKISFSKADAFVAVSEYVKTHTGKLLSFGNKPVRVINYPVSLHKFYNADPEKAVPFRLVFAGTVCEKKGIRQLLLALSEVARFFPDVHLEVFGRDWFFNGGRSYIQFLKEEINPEILKRVRFHGPVSHDELPGYYEEAEICIFPSHMETQGLVAPEAMAMGKPVIFSQNGPGPETIDHSVNGWLCNPYSPEAIASCVINAFESRANFLKIGEAARLKVMKKFDPEIITDSNLEFYKSLFRKR